MNPAQEWLHAFNVFLISDYTKGFGGKFGVQTDRQDKSAVGWDHQEKLQLHESQKGTTVLGRGVQRKRHVRLDLEGLMVPSKLALGSQCQFQGMDGMETSPPKTPSMSHMPTSKYTSAFSCVDQLFFLLKLLKFLFLTFITHIWLAKRTKMNCSEKTSFFSVCVRTQWLNAAPVHYSPGCWGLKAYPSKPWCFLTMCLASQENLCSNETTALSAVAYHFSLCSLDVVSLKANDFFFLHSMSVASVQRGSEKLNSHITTVCWWLYASAQGPLNSPHYTLLFLNILFQFVCLNLC